MSDDHDTVDGHKQRQRWLHWQHQHTTDNTSIEYTQQHNFILSDFISDIFLRSLLCSLPAVVLVSSLVVQVVSVETHVKNKLLQLLQLKGECQETV